MVVVTNAIKTANLYVKTNQNSILLEKSLMMNQLSAKMLATNVLTWSRFPGVDGTVILQPQNG